VRLFLDGAIKIVHTAPWPTIQTEMSLATAGIYRMIRLRLPGVTEDCSIVQMLYRQRCCMYMHWSSSCWYMSRQKSIKNQAHAVRSQVLPETVSMGM